MGNPKLKWTREEEDALRRGVAKHGAGKWKNIHQDPEFGPALRSRSNIDLKDKWRNLGVASGQITRDKSKSKSKTKNAITTTTTPVPVSPMFVASATTTEVAMSESSDQAQMIDELLSKRCGAITDSKENRRTIKTEEPPERKRESSQQQTSHHNPTLTEEQTALWVASKIAQAEDTSSVAAESLREAERISTD